MSPEITIVIPTINRYSDLKNTLNDLKSQSFQNYEILIIDQTDRAIAEVIEMEKVRHLWRPFKSASKARNLALMEAQSPIVLFLDDDVIIENKDFVRKHLEHFKNPKTSGVSGAILNMDKRFIDNLPKKASKKELGWIYFPRNYSQHDIVSDGGAGNLSVRKDWAIDVGGMDENYDKGAYREESDFCIRYVRKYGKLEYDPDAYLVHIGNPTGGTRSWKSSVGIIHAYQHMFGSWYFMFKILPFYTWPEYSYLMIRRFILHKKLFVRVYLWPSAIWRYTGAMISALISYTIKGPSHIEIEQP